MEQESKIIYLIFQKMTLLKTQNDPILKQKAVNFQYFFKIFLIKFIIIELVNITTEECSQMINTLFPCINNLFSLFNNPQSYKIKNYTSQPFIENDADITQSKNYDFFHKSNSQFYLPFDHQCSKPTNIHLRNCDKSVFILLTNIENVFVDTCENCTIFIAPCHSTVFIRNCKNLKVRAICQQLRLENSSHLNIEGIVGVQPVLQRCRQINLISLSCKLQKKIIEKAYNLGIKVMENKIYDCFDFTPKSTPNYTNTISNHQTDNQWKYAYRNLNIKDNNLINIPKKIPIKRSQMKKLYLSDCRQKIVIIYANCSQIQLLQRMEKNYDDIQFMERIDENIGVKMLKNKYIFVDEKIWTFWVVKAVKEEIEGNFQVIREKEIIKNMIQKIYL